jgi:hypothetical protein
VKTEDEIAELFASANPRPYAVPDDTVGQMSASGTADSLLDMVVFDGDTGRAAAPPRPRRRWWEVAAAAAAVLAVLGGLGALAASLGHNDGAPSRTADAVAVADLGAVTATVEEFVAAFNERDIDAMEAMMAPGHPLTSFLPFDSSDGLTPSLMEWFAAFDWRWEIDGCRTVTDRVTCDVEQRNRLTDYTETQLPGVMSFTLVDGRIGAIVETVDWGMYSRQAFRPFALWVATVHPDDVGIIWAKPVTAESAQRLDDRLAEYTASPEPPRTPLETFLAARSAADSETVVATLTPDAAVDDLWATTPADYADTLAVLDAMDWSWEIKDCELDEITSDATRLRCLATATSVWSDAGIGGSVSAARLEVSVSGDRVSAVSSSLTAERLDRALTPWYEWLRSEHPDDVDTMFDTTDGAMVPRATPEALELIETLSQEWTSTRS